MVRPVDQAEPASRWVAPLQTLGRRGFELSKPISVVLCRDDGDYVASFHEAAISATGDVEEEALFNLADLIVESYVALTSYDPSQLGPLPARQLTVLREFVREVAASVQPEQG
jgi:hypothetical protein